jgi:hypothetical protein
MDRKRVKVKKRTTEFKQETDLKSKERLGLKSTGWWLEMEKQM